MATEVNGDYEHYLERYARDHKLTKDEAEQHAMVKLVKEYYEQK